MNVYTGINLEDIYNTFSKDRSDFNIKKNKWLLFEFSESNEINILIYILNDLLDINSIIQQKSWTMLNEEQKNNFFSKWELFKKAIENNEDLIYSNNILKNVFVSFVSYFEIHYKNIYELVKNKKYLKLKFNLTEDDDEDILNIDSSNRVIVKDKTTNLIDYYNAIKDTPIEDIYSFLYDEINSFKITPFNFILFDKNEIGENVLKDIKYNKVNLNDPSSYQITPKNYYNLKK